MHAAGRGRRAHQELGGAAGGGDGLVRNAHHAAFPTRCAGELEPERALAEAGRHEVAVELAVRQHDVLEVERGCRRAQ